MGWTHEKREKEWEKKKWSRAHEFLCSKTTSGFSKTIPYIRKGHICVQKVSILKYKIFKGYNEMLFFRY